MEILTFKIQFVTPAFIGGAHPLEDPSELRASSLKGLLRYWWRVFFADPAWNYDQLLQEEARYFGFQDEGRSPFSIRIKKIPPQENEIRPWALSNNPNDPLRYLFFSTVQRVNNRDCILPGSKYQIDFIIRDREAKKHIVKALWALESFGGIGLRSRRGAGSFRVYEIINKRLHDQNSREIVLSSDQAFNVIERIWPASYPKFLFFYSQNQITPIQLPNFFNTFIRDNIPKLLQAGGDYSSANNQAIAFTRYSNFFRFLPKVYSLPPSNAHRSWSSTLSTLGAKYKEFRNHAIPGSIFNTEACALHSFADGNAYRGPDPITKPAFGLPIIYNFGQGANRIKLQTKVMLNGKPRERRSSPLFFKIGNYNGSHYAMISFFPSRFLPNGATLQIGRQNFSIPDYSQVTNFLDTL